MPTSIYTARSERPCRHACPPISRREEYIVSGTANVYEWATDGSVKVKTSDAPYTTRILVRRPAAATRFSGNVILEPMENARAWDWAFMWGASYEYFIERGDMWVGVTST